MIGIFDSGYGGLTVLKGFLKELPEYDYLYLGDNARMPYGGRSPETIQQFTDEAVQFFMKQKVQLVIIACNTSSANALHNLQQKYLDQVKILGVIRPHAEFAVKASKNKKIGIVGTRATIASKVYEREIHKLDPDIKVIGQACPLIVPLIEEHWQKKPETRMILRKYLRPLKTHNIDTLVLGCTHYPILHKEFQNMMGKNVRVLRTSDIMAASLKNYLKRHPEIESKLTKNSKCLFLTTDDDARFAEFGKIFLGNALNGYVWSVTKCAL